MIKATIINNSNTNVYIKGRAYFSRDKTFQLIGSDLYNKLKENEIIEVKINGFMYDNLEKLNIEELKIIAEFYDIESYWLKNKDTLVNTIKEKQEDEGDN